MDTMASSSMASLESMSGLEGNMVSSMENLGGGNS
uniref:Uncharacterized protein n=1 Tax=Arundo donax TaxID=35708 RepID=A0A0A8YCZ8_ARUDO